MGSNPNHLTRVLAKGGAIWEALRLVQDNWQNVFTGLGTSRDKTQYGSFISLVEVSETELTALYHQDDTAKRVVGLKPQEMVRRGFYVNVEEDTDTSTAIGQKIRDLKAAKVVRDAMIWGRLYGGSVVVIGADDGQPADKPLREDAIKSVRWLHVVDKRWLVPETYYEDPLQDELFGEPQTYRIVPRRATQVVNMVVHRSRLLVFGGAHTSDEERDRLGGWDYSVLNAVYGVLRAFNDVWASSQHLMADASQGVFKIAGLMDMIAGGQKEELQTRMQLVDMSRSVARAILLDSDHGEDFTKEGTSFTDAAAMLDRWMQRLASAAEVPATILMGRSPAGMNATGEADFRWFYDSIATAQKNDLSPELEKLVRLLFLAKDGPTRGNVPETWEIIFHPLWQPTPKEQAEVEKLTADKDKLYVDTGVLLPEEVSLSRFRAEGWSAETQIDRDLREGTLETEAALSAEPVDEEKSEDEPEEKETATGKVVLAPTDIAIVVTVNEARASQGLTDWPDPEEGGLTVAEFKARKEVEGAAVGEAEGEAAAEEIKPDDKTPEPAPPPSFGAPSVPPVVGAEGEDEGEGD